jgi:tRNA pseudouridine38-40 synthase
MANFKLILEYDGSEYVGWQRQPDEASIQASLEEAVYQFSGERVRVKGAGRTDAGVHALGQVADVALTTRVWRTDKVRDAINHYLKPQPISILSCEEVDDNFSARFSAIRRHYLYRLADRRPPLTLTRGQAWWWPVKLDIEAMADAAEVLVGRHDFTTFRSTSCQAKSPVRDVEGIELSRVGDEIHIEVRARSFLHNQVRSFVGSLKLVGEGRWTKADVEAALGARKRTACGPIAPSEGLYLVRVDYP